MLSSWNKEEVETLLIKKEKIINKSFLAKIMKINQLIIINLIIWYIIIIIIVLQIIKKSKIEKNRIK